MATRHMISRLSEQIERQLMAEVPPGELAVHDWDDAADDLVERLLEYLPDRGALTLADFR